MKSKLLLFAFFKFSFVLAQIKRDGSNCENAIIISDTVESIQLPSVAAGVCWYKFKSSSFFLTLKLFRLGNYIIYESPSEDFCATSSKDNILFAFGDSLSYVDNEYIRHKAAQLNGVCYCNNCLKTELFFKAIKLKEDSYYYIQLINVSQPFELQFNHKSNLATHKLQLTTKKKQGIECKIVFMKSFTTGMINNADSLKNKPFNSQEWVPIKYGLHIYYIKRDLQQRTFKIRDYVLDEITSKCMLDSLVKYLFDNPEKKILITGFVTKGEDKLAEKYELAASEALAKIVRNYLVDHKVSVNRIKIEGKGSSQQLNKDEKSKISFMYELNGNNRVEIKLSDESNGK